MQAHFYNELPNRIELLTEKWNQFSQNQFKDHVLLSDMHKKAHSLAGTAGTFGATAVGNSAHQLEITLKTALDAVPTISDTTSHTIADQLEHLKLTAREWRPSVIPHIPEVPTCRDSFNNLIFLVEDDQLLASQLINELEAHKYQVRHFTDTSTIIDDCKQKTPALIIMDMV
ncbi:MAG: Hpt domain-containing protein, partial [Gammaproteobacteria bacterium]|nr:Hpt domain-containing protein [Gammaproteobacteria bacterium]